MYSQVLAGVDLEVSGYAAGAVPIVELRVAKAARRLAGWLDALIGEGYDHGREVELGTVPGWGGAKVKGLELGESRGGQQVLG